MIRVLFLCHGNICRSPMAEYMFRDLLRKEGLSERFEVSSAAVSREEIGNDVYPPAKEILRRKGIPFERRRARQVTKEDLGYYDHILIMDAYNGTYLRRLFPSADLSKVSLLLSYAGKDRDISDPWYTGDFERTYEDLEEGLKAFLHEVY